MMSMAVVRGIGVVDMELTTSGVGNAARRVLEGAGTVMVCVWILVTVSVS